MSRFILVAASAFALASPALVFAAPDAPTQAPVAGEATPPAAPEAAAPSIKPEKDPNRMICRRDKETGSRLGAKKTCMTAAEWETQRQLQTAEIDKIQRGRPLNGE